VSEIEFGFEMARNADGMAERLLGGVREIAGYEDGFNRDVLRRGKGWRTGRGAGWRTSDHLHPLLELHRIRCGLQKAEYKKVPGSLPKQVPVLM
jgi:hypothetical protein